MLQTTIQQYIDQCRQLSADVDKRLAESDAKDMAMYLRYGQSRQQLAKQAQQVYGKPSQRELFNAHQNMKKLNETTQATASSARPLIINNPV